MGMSKKKKDEFRAKHPNCIFCGGNVAATTVEHCPPRAMFRDRAWPEGFEFPACSKCNHGTADQDLIIALLARSDPFRDPGDTDGRMGNIIGSVNQKFPGLLAKMMPSANEARRINRRLGIALTPGQTNQEAGAVNVTDEMHYAVEIFSAKLTKAIFYMHSGGVFPNDGRLTLRWFTNSELFTNDGRYSLFDIMEQLGGLAPELRRANTFLNDQFSYKISFSTELDLLVLQAQFGHGFGFVVVGSSAAEKLDSIFASLDKQTGKNNPFKTI